MTARTGTAEASGDGSGAGVASDFTQLVFHALAHLPLTGPESLHDPGYLAWARARLPAPAWRALADDAPLIAALYERAEGAVWLQSAVDLFRDIAQARASGSAALDELRPADVASAPVLALLRRLDPTLVELFRAALLLAADGFAGAWPHHDCAAGVATLAPWLEEARALHPELGSARVELVWALGSRGRAFPDRILVGVPGDWRRTPPETVAVLALHEASVRWAGRRLRRLAPERPQGSRPDGGSELAASPTYLRAEWAGLADLSARMRAASPALRGAHQAWLASLALAGLCEGASALGFVEPALADRVRAFPEERAEALGSWRWAGDE